MTVKHAYTATGTNDGTKQVSVTRWNDDHAIDMEGLVIPWHTSTPTAPAADNVKLFCKEVANRAMPAFIGPSGLDATLQPHIGRQSVRWIRPLNASSNQSAFGMNQLTAVGTGTGASVSTTSFHTRMIRQDYLVTTASTGAVAGFRYSGNNDICRGTVANANGFHFIVRCAPATGGTVSTNRFFTGLSATTGATAPTDVNPSTLLNICGAGWDSGDSNWQIFFNDGSGSATKVNTGIAKPTTDRSSPMEISVFSPPAGNSISVQVLNIETGASYMASESTDIPSADTLLNMRGYHSVGGTSSVVGYTLFNLYIEVDN